MYEVCKAAEPLADIVKLLQKYKLTKTNIKFFDGIKKVKWLNILLFYFIILVGTFFARKSPNILNLLLEKITDIQFTFNYNHGFVTLITAFLFYKFSRVKQEITLLGNQKFKSVLFPIILFLCYSVIGISNNQGINKHLWAFIFCFFAFIYNLMEEFAWRGYLIDSLKPVNYIIKSLISGIFWAFWHLLIFKNFDQYGGFVFFLLFCIIFSFILTFAVTRTKSIIVTAAIHSFIIQTNVATLICFSIFILLLATWNKNILSKHNIS